MALVDVKSRQNASLKNALARQPEVICSKFETLSVGDNIVNAVRTRALAISTSLDAVKNASPTTAAELQGTAGQVKSSAKQLDEAALHAHEALNEAFKATYKQINDTKVKPSWMPSMHA